MAQQQAKMQKIVEIRGHAVVEEYAMYNLKHSDGSESVRLEYDIVGAKKLLDRYKQDVDPQNLSNTGVYAVESILNHRKVGAKTLFLVQWSGYENPVWHTELARSDLKDSKQAIQDYVARLEKPKKKNRITRGRKNQTVRRAKDEESSSDSESTSSDSDAGDAQNGYRDAGKPTTSKRARDSDDKESESGDSDEEGMGESAGDEDEEMVEDEQRDDDEDGSDGGLEMMPDHDDDDDEGEADGEGPIVEHPDDDGEDEADVDANVAHAQGEERRRIRLWNHRWHQYHVLQHEMEYATRFLITFGFPPLYIPAYDPEGPVALVPPEHEPYVEEPEDEEE